MEIEIKHDISVGIDYSNSERVWKGITELIKLDRMKRKNG